MARREPVVRVSRPIAMKLEAQEKLTPRASLDDSIFVNVQK